MIRKKPFRLFFAAFLLFAGGIFILPAGEIFSAEELSPDERREIWLKKREETLERLRKPVSAEFHNTPLPEVVRYLNETYDARFRLDETLPEGGVSLKITLEAKDVPLDTLLYRLFGQWDKCTCYIDEDTGEICLGITTLGFYDPWQGPYSDDPPQPVGPFSEAAQEMLRKPVTVAFEKTPLADAVRFLNETYDARLRLDDAPPDDEEPPKWFGDDDEEEEGFGGAGAVSEPVSDLEITFSAGDISLRNALYWILAPWDMAYYADGDEIVLTTREEMESRYFEKFYPLLWEEDTETPSLFTCCVDPNSWEIRGGRGYLLSTPEKTHLRVIQDQYVMEECDAFYLKITGNSPPPTAAEKHLAEVLETVVSLDYEEISLREILADIARRYRITVVCDVTDDEPFTFHLHGVTLRSALRTMFRGLGIDFLAHHEVLQVSSKDDILEHLPVTLLPLPSLGFLLENGEWAPVEEDEYVFLRSEGEGYPGYPMDDIMSILYAHVERSRWFGGNERSLTWSFGLWRLVVVRTEEEVQDIKAILDFLDGAPWPRSPEEEKISRVLVQPVNLKYAEPGVPLAQIAADLEKACGISVIVDTEGRWSDIDPEANFVLDARNRPLRDALNEMLQPAGLGFAFYDDSLMIADRNVMECRCFTRGYEISLGENESAEDFADTLKETVRPDTWQDYDRGRMDGELYPGDISFLGNRFFIIQTLEGHMEIEKFLENRKKENAK